MNKLITMIRLGMSISSVLTTGCAIDFTARSGGQDYALHIKPPATPADGWTVRAEAPGFSVAGTADTKTDALTE
jgi:hypothetical protein